MCVVRPAVLLLAYFNPRQFLQPLNMQEVLLK